MTMSLPYVTDEQQERVQLKLVDEAGEPYLFRLGKHIQPLSRLFREYSEKQNIPLDNLTFNYGAVSLHGHCSQTPAELGMSDGDEIYVKVINPNLVPSNKPVKINFICDDGHVTSFIAPHNIEICRLFEDYAQQRKIPLILHHFYYLGVELASNCGDTVAQLKISDGDTIYIEINLPYKDALDDYFSVTNLQTAVYNTAPRYFLQQRVAKKFGSITTIGTIVDYVGDEKRGLWRIEFPEEGLRFFSRNDLIKGLRHHYENNGVDVDFSVYVSEVAGKVISDCGASINKVEILTNNLGCDASDTLIELIRIDEEIDRVLPMTARVPKFGDDEGSSSLSQSMTGMKKQIPVSKQNMVTKSLCRVKKPMMEPGEKVYAEWWPHHVSTADQTWKPGVIKSFREYGDIGGYGSCRIYGVQFDNGDYHDDIADYQVMHTSEHLFMRNFGPSLPDGVEHEFEMDSDDAWARKGGWYTVRIDGVDEAFALLSNALRAKDAYTVSRKGYDVQKHDLNLSQEWDEFTSTANDREKRISETNKAKSERRDIGAQQRLRVRLILATELLPAGDMKRIGQALIHWSQPNSKWIHLNDGSMSIYDGNIPFFHNCHNIQHDELAIAVQLAYHWKEAHGCAKEGNTTLLKEHVCKFALLLQCVVNQTSLALMSRFYICAEGHMNAFSQQVPIFHEGYNSTKSLQDMTSYLQSNLNHAKCGIYGDTAEALMFLYVIDANNDALAQRHILNSMRSLKTFLTQYAAEKNTPVKSLRIEYNGRTIFLSSIGNKEPSEIGLKEDDVINIHVLKPQSGAPTEKNEPRTKSKKQASKGKKKKKTGAKSKKKTPVQIKVPEDGAKIHKRIWMDNISRVFAEADPTFRDIRQRLNAMGLQRTLPKQRKKQAKSEPATKPVDNPLIEGTGGKAGKSYFIIQVGEVSNLYKTTKPSAMRGRSSNQARCNDIMIDLHGLTKDEALAKLDKNLPKWVDTAMKGEHPFVIPLKIVCGGGNQILSEAVESWIKQNDQVSNAPKNLYC